MSIGSTFYESITAIEIVSDELDAAVLFPSKKAEMRETLDDVAENLEEAREAAQEGYNEIFNILNHYFRSDPDDSLPTSFSEEEIHELYVNLVEAGHSLA
jgi:hypothetical protein